MIVVRANLYRARAESARRIRPKLLFAAAGAVLLCVLFVSDFAVASAAAGYRRQLRGSQELLAKVHRDVAKAKTADAELRKSVARRDAILARARQRANWAPALAKMLAASRPTVELSGLEIDVEQAGRPKLRVTGRCAGQEPRLEADKCRLQMTHALNSAGIPVSGQFESLEDAPSRHADGNGNSGVADFVILFSTAHTSHAE